jgi:hypothetical protein
LASASTSVGRPNDRQTSTSAGRIVEAFPIEGGSVAPEIRLVLVSLAVVAVASITAWALQTFRV